MVGAIQAFEAVGERGSLGHALAMAGRLGEARATLKQLERQSQREYVSPVQAALVHVGLGDIDAALASLERAFAIRAVDLAAAGVDPRFAPLRADPRFGALLHRMNLP